MNKVIMKIKRLAHNLSSDRLYEVRNKKLLDYKVRNKWTILIGLFFVGISMAMLILSSWVPDNHSEYIESQNGISAVANKEVIWAASALQSSECGITAKCLKQMNNFAPTTIEKLDSVVNSSDSPKILAMKIAMPVSVFDSLRSEPTFKIAIPNFRYERASVFLGEEILGKYYRNQAIDPVFEQQSLDSAQEFLHFVVLMEVLPSDRTIQNKRTHEGFLVSNQSGFDTYQKYLYLKSSGAVGSMGTVAKIVLALFCLMLFLIVDSSPESVGLALFMVFEAVALGVGRDWIPLDMLGIGHKMVITNTFYQMGDILKIYFFLQLARVGTPRVMPWILWGFAVSIPYGFFMEYAHLNSFTWQYKIPRTRDTLAGTIGFVVCLHSLIALRNKPLPWRKSALLIGITAALVEISKSWISHSDLITIFPLVATVVAIMEANLGYIYALSTFLNISTLENRVATLTEEKSKANEIQKQMELGQSLQKAFLKLPALPNSVKFSCYHKAAVYVSGDTYFVHWNESQNVVTFLLNDVTGHGIQAALKAFAGNIIAKTVWVDSPLDPRRVVQRRKQQSGMERYDKLVDELLCHIDPEETEDFNALLGAEFEVDTGELKLYRANYNFPFVVQPDFDWTLDLENSEDIERKWTFNKVSVPNRQVKTLDLKPGGFVIFISDGYIETSRDELSFLRSLKKAISMNSQNVNSESLKKNIIDWALATNKDLIHDDQTVMVFQYTPTKEVLDLRDSNMKRAVA